VTGTVRLRHPFFTSDRALLVSPPRPKPLSRPLVSNPQDIHEDAWRLGCRRAILPVHVQAIRGSFLSTKSERAG
jgi:hypothetical protein